MISPVSDIVSFVSASQSISRIAGNFMRKQKAKRIIQKLDSNTRFKTGIAESIYFMIGKIENPVCESIFNGIRENAINIQTQKYKVKKVSDMTRIAS